MTILYGEEDSRYRYDWPTCGWFDYHMKDNTEHSWVLRDGITITNVFRFHITMSNRWYRKPRGWHRDDTGDYCGMIRIGYIEMHCEKQTEDDKSEDVWRHWNRKTTTEWYSVNGVPKTREIPVDKTKPHIVLAIPADVHHITLDRKQAMKLARILFKFARTGIVQAIQNVVQLKKAA